MHITLSILLLLIAVILFAAEAVRGRSLLAAGLTCFAGSFLVVQLIVT